MQNYKTHSEAGKTGTTDNREAQILSRFNNSLNQVTAFHLQTTISRILMIAVVDGENSILDDRDKNMLYQLSQFAEDIQTYFSKNQI